MNDSMKARILVVDDDPNLLELLVDTLATVGYRVTPASDGHKALDRLREQRFYLVISDIKMPGIDGISLMRKIRRRYPNLPVVFITGVLSPQMIGSS